MKITRRQLKQLIMEAFKDLSSLLPGPATSSERPGRRRLVRPKGMKPAPRGFVRDIGDEIPFAGEGTPAQINEMSDVRFDDRKASSLTSSSPFVAGSPDYHATYQHTYSDEDLQFFVKRLDFETGQERWIPIKGDYPDHEENSYVMIPALFNRGILGVCQIMASMNLTATTIDGKPVKIPVLTLRSITSGRMISKVGKAFVKKVAGSRSLHKAEEIEHHFRPKFKGYRE